MGDTKRGSQPPKLTSLEALGAAAECLKTLAHPHRLRIVQMLLGGRYPVGELAEACGIPSHMASEHLRLMQRCGFLDVEKEGRCVYYTVAEPHLRVGRDFDDPHDWWGATMRLGSDAHVVVRPDQHIAH